jgi:hypothetical protein
VNGTRIPNRFALTRMKQQAANNVLPAISVKASFLQQPDRTSRPGWHQALRIYYIALVGLVFRLFRMIEASNTGSDKLSQTKVQSW